MKKNLVLLVVLLLFWSCSLQNVKQETSMYSGKTQEQVFSAVTMALVDCQYTIKTSDAEGGLLLATRSANFASENNPPQVTVVVFTDSTGTPGVKIQYTQLGQVADMLGTNKKAIQEILAAINNNLK